MKTNKILKWLREQNRVNNHLFKTSISYEDFLLNDVDEEILKEISNVFDISIHKATDILKALQTNAINTNTTRNSFLMVEHTFLDNKEMIISLHYELKCTQSYSKHEAVAKRKLKELLVKSGLNIQSIHFCEVVRNEGHNNYIFTVKEH